MLTLWLTNRCALVSIANTAWRENGDSQLGRALFQRRIDRGKLGVELGAEPVDHGNDGKRYAGGNQAVLDGGRAGLIGAKSSNQCDHGRQRASDR